MTVPLPDAGTDPAGYLLAASEVRERRIKAATQDGWTVVADLAECKWCGDSPCGPHPRFAVSVGPFNVEPLAEANLGMADAEHIAAEANPAHALAEVALWRGIAGRHVSVRGPFDKPLCAVCGELGGGYNWQHAPWPCPDLLGAVGAARAYLEGTGR